MFGSSSKPRDWYDMSYEQQREWERADRKHRDEVDDAERQAREAREQLDNFERREARSRRERIAEREEIGWELEQLRTDLENITAERDGLCDLVRRFRDALDHYAKPETGWDLVEHADLYEESKVLVPLEAGEEKA